MWATLGFTAETKLPVTNSVALPIYLDFSKTNKQTNKLVRPAQGPENQSCWLFSLAEPQENYLFHSNGLFNLASSLVFNQKSLNVKFPKF